MNGADVEEILWWAACTAQIEGIEGMRAHLPEPKGDARVSDSASCLLPRLTTVRRVGVMHHYETTQHNGSTEDTRVPMPALFQLWQGTVPKEEVLRIAQRDGTQDAEAYANFYVGLFLECSGEGVEAQPFFEAAAAYPAAGFMGEVMQLHSRLSKEVVPRRQLGGPDRPAGSHSVIIGGGWQLSSGHHDGMDPLGAMRDMEEALSRGVTTIDCGDIYTGVEEVIGRFLARYAQRGGDSTRVEIHTKVTTAAGIYLYPTHFRL